MQGCAVLVFAPRLQRMVSGDDIAALEAKRVRLLNQLRTVSKDIVQARQNKAAEEKAAKDARLARVAGMMDTMTLAEIGQWESLSTSRVHALVNEIKRRRRAEQESH